MPKIVTAETRQPRPIVTYKSLLPNFEAYVSEEVPEFGTDSGQARICSSPDGREYINWGYKFDGGKGSWVVYNFCLFPESGVQTVEAGQMVTARVDFIKKTIMHPDGKSVEHIAIELHEKSDARVRYEIVIGVSENVPRPNFGTKDTRGCRIAVQKIQRESEKIPNTRMGHNKNWREYASAAPTNDTPTTMAAKLGALVSK